MYMNNEKTKKTLVQQPNFFFDFDLTELTQNPWFEYKPNQRFGFDLKTKPRPKKD